MRDNQDKEVVYLSFSKKISKIMLQRLRRKADENNIMIEKSSYNCFGDIYSKTMTEQ